MVFLAGKSGKSPDIGSYTVRIQCTRFWPTLSWVMPWRGLRTRKSETTRQRTRGGSSNLQNHSAWTKATTSAFSCALKSLCVWWNGWQCNGHFIQASSCKHTGLHRTARMKIHTYSTWHTALPVNINLEIDKNKISVPVGTNGGLCSTMGRGLDLMSRLKKPFLSTIADKWYDTLALRDGMVRHTCMVRHLNGTTLAWYDTWMVWHTCPAWWHGTTHLHGTTLEWYDTCMVWHLNGMTHLPCVMAWYDTLAWYDTCMVRHTCPAWWQRTGKGRIRILQHESHSILRIFVQRFWSGKASMLTVYKSQAYQSLHSQTQKKTVVS